MEAQSQTAAATAAATDGIVNKVAKTIEGLKAKNAKLQEENAKVKKAFADFKTAHSRVRRIPKKGAAIPEGETAA